MDWIVDEITNLENKMTFYFDNTKRDIIMSEKYEDYRKNNICRLCENIHSDKVRDHCRSTGKNRVPAHKKNVTQNQSNFIPFTFHNFSNYDCHLFFKKLVDKQNDEVKFDFIRKTNEEHISVTYGCERFKDSFRILSSSLDSLVKTFFDNKHKTLEKKLLEMILF